DEALLPSTLGRPRAALAPAPIFRRQEHWAALTSHSGGQESTLPGRLHEVTVGAEAVTCRWRIRLDAVALPAVTDHRIGDQVLMPGAFYLEFFRASARAVSYQISAFVDVHYEQVLELVEGAVREVDTTMSVSNNGAT